MEWYILGILGALLTTFGFVPQILLMKKSRSAKDVSIVTLYQFSGGVLLWALYGIYIRDNIIIAANSITLITLVVAIGFYHHYNRS
ncbi:MAG: SemiSWEET family transporter [ANME-2 cluster archaeon]|nr:SemiSWEET family transporter [ANME-2 cluster archaeon]